jgi:hypothetical protein
MHRIKITFNKEFDDIHLKKVSEIGKIKEKNKRINKILNDLDLNEEVPLPTLSYYEEPEQLHTYYNKAHVPNYYNPHSK